jgi:hypothetical protein
VPSAVGCGLVWFSVPDGGPVLLSHAGRDSPAGADRDAVLFRPRPDLAAALPPGRRPAGPAGRPASRLMGVLDIGLALLAEGPRILGAQVDLILGAVEPEPHCLIGRAPSRSSSGATVTF